jgi:hypothetical protein
MPTNNLHSAEPPVCHLMTGREILRAVNAGTPGPPVMMHFPGGIESDASILFGTHKDTLYGVSFEVAEPMGGGWFTTDRWLRELIANGHIKLVEADLLVPGQ